MHIFFSGIGGTAIGPLALIAKQAGYEISGSDQSSSTYIDSLSSQGITDIYIGQTRQQIEQVHNKKPIDWFVYSSALPKTDPNHPEMIYAKEHGIKTTKRDELINQILNDKDLQMVAIAGTHGKTTTTAMAIWVFRQLGLPISYSVGAKLSFGDMGAYESKSQYFIYEADEYDRNFLSFYPKMSLITGLDWDHPDVYPTKDSYLRAFLEFIDQSGQSVLWHTDAERLALDGGTNHLVLDETDPQIHQQLKLPGAVNRLDGWLVAQSLHQLLGLPPTELIEVLNKFPGVSRRFEQIIPGLYTDYAHTPPKIRGALQLADEVAGKNVVVIYEGLHNNRQHFIKNELKHLFDSLKHLYIVPSYLAREDENLELLTPSKILNLLSIEAREHSEAAELNDELIVKINNRIQHGDTVLALSAGGSNSLDEWLRQNFSQG